MRMRDRKSLQKISQPGYGTCRFRGNVDQTYLLVWGNGAPIPGFSGPAPNFRGWGGDGDRPHKNFGGFSGMGMAYTLGFFWGFIPENPQKIIGETLGTGIGFSLGIY